MMILTAYLILCKILSIKLYIFFTVIYVNGKISIYLNLSNGSNTKTNEPKVHIWKNYDSRLHQRVIRIDRCFMPVMSHLCKFVFADGFFELL